MTSDAYQCKGITSPKQAGAFCQGGELQSLDYRWFDCVIFYGYDEQDEYADCLVEYYYCFACTIFTRGDISKSDNNVNRKFLFNRCSRAYMKGHSNILKKKKKIKNSSLYRVDGFLANYAEFFFCFSRNSSNIASKDFFSDLSMNFTTIFQKFLLELRQRFLEGLHERFLQRFSKRSPLGNSTDPS